MQWLSKQAVTILVQTLALVETACVV